MIHLKEVLKLISKRIEEHKEKREDLKGVKFTKEEQYIIQGKLKELYSLKKEISRKLLQLDEKGEYNGD